MNLKIVYLVAVLCFLELCIGDEKKPFRKQGLYNDTDKVIDLNATSFREFVFDKPYASFAEFYNSYCGFCRRFAPKWKEFAEYTEAWQRIVYIVAIDCSVDANNDICREFEIMAYPTIRYFSPNYKSGPKMIGTFVDEEGKDSLDTLLVNLLRNETDTPPNWPSLMAYTQYNMKNLFDSLPPIVQYVFIVYCENGSLVGYEVTLDLHAIKQIAVRQVESSNVGNSLGLTERPGLYAVNKNFEITPVTFMNFTKSALRNSITQFIHNRIATTPGRNRHTGKNYYTESEYITKPEATTENAVDLLQQKQNEAILNLVLNKKGTVFQADLENALRYTLYHEIPQIPEISGDRLAALRRYINVVNRYSPLGDDGKNFLQELQTFVEGTEPIRGESFENEIKLLTAKYAPIFSSNRWVGCISSAPNLRGFTCGLWLLFHHFTVSASTTDKSEDPSEVLQAVYDYVRNFFGCTECSKHFQTMAAKNNIWSVATKDDAVLWLWSAHNEVNKRLSVDLTNDPEFPKVQYPERNVCSQCRLQTTYNHSYGPEWNKTEVLQFFKNIYAPQNINWFGMDNDTIVGAPSAAAQHAQRIGGNVFSELDIRVGLLLYIFCIGMMVLAVKMFIQRRGYRKKIYSHDFLGKP